jgi:magnesium-transporting ATPase (P-type)
MTIIPKKLGAPKHPSEIQVSPEIMEVSVSEPEQAYQKLGTSNQGLSAAEAARRLKEHGPNVVAQDKRHNRWRLLGRAFDKPLSNPAFDLGHGISANRRLTGYGGDGRHGGPGSGVAICPGSSG